MNPLVNHFGLVDLSLMVVATAKAKVMDIPGIRIKAKLVNRVLCTIIVLMWSSQL